MANPYILIRVPDVLEWKPLSRTPVVMSEDDQDRFAHWLLALYKKRLQTAIKNQSFPVRYAALSPKWKNYKKSRRMKAGFWQATENLRRNLQVWKQGGTYLIGYKANERHPVWKRPYAQILAALEKGNPEGGLPARPLFTPVARNLSKSIGRHVETFMRSHAQ